MKNMLVVKVELHSAIGGKIETIGQMVIDNIGGDTKRGNYRVRVMRKSSAMISMLRGKVQPARAGEVFDYPRQSYSVWRLVFRALAECYPEEKNYIREADK